MTKKQEKFANEYFKTGNIYKSALSAGYSEKYSKDKAYKLLKKVGICRYLKKLEQKYKQDTIAETTEILVNLTAIIRGELKSEITYTTENGEITKVIKDTPIKDRLKACELLGKRYRLFNGEEEQYNRPIIIITGENELED